VGDRNSKGVFRSAVILFGILFLSGCGEFSEIKEFKTIKLSIHPRAENIQGKGYSTLANSDLTQFNQIYATTHIEGQDGIPEKVYSIPTSGVLDITANVLDGQSFWVGVLAWNCGIDTPCTSEANSAVNWYFDAVQVFPSSDIQPVDLYLGSALTMVSRPVCNDDSGGPTSGNDDLVCNGAEYATQVEVMAFGGQISTGLRATGANGATSIPQFDGPHVEIKAYTAGPTNIGFTHLSTEPFNWPPPANILVH